MAYTFPLKVSSNGRYLVDQANTPVLLVGEDAFSGISQLTQTDIDLYLANRAAKGFNVVWVTLVDHHFCTNAPNDILNNPPFTGATFTTPGTAYFNKADYLFTAAAALQMVVLCTPLYIGFSGTQEGWHDAIVAASNADMTSWGTYVGNRYKNQPNIVWVIGGDTDPTSLASKCTSFVTALQAADPNHVITAHNVRGQMAVTPWPGATWLTVNDTYSGYLDTVSQSQTAYSQSGPLPFFQIEAIYEHESNMTHTAVRSQIWWTMTSGGVGHVFGDNPVWGFSSPPVSSFADAGTDPNWKNNLETSGALAMKYMAQGLQPRQWQNLVPDTSNLVLTAGMGTLGTSSYATAAQSADKTLLLAYLPAGGTVTINMARMQSCSRARWLDPTSGTFTDVTGMPFLNSGSVSITPPAHNGAGDTDWVLIVEALDPGMPGSWTAQ